MKALWSLVVVLHLAVAAMAQEPAIASYGAGKNPESDLDFAALKDLLAKKQVRSIEGWLTVLQQEPKHRSFLKNFALVYDSNGQTESDDPGSVSAKHPRIILQSGHLTLAFNTDPSHPKTFQRLEILEHVPGSSRFRSHRIDFQGADKVPHIQENSETCAKCHGGSRRPLWANYNVWPGIIGSIDDSLPMGTSERQQVLDHYRKATSGSRLGFLGLTPEMTAEDWVNMRLNTRMTARLNALNFSTILQELKDWKDLARYQYAIAGALFYCKDFASFFPAEILKKHEAALKLTLAKTIESVMDQGEKGHQGKAARLEKVHPKKAVAEAIAFQKENVDWDYERLGNLRFVLEGAGLPAKGWSLDRNPGGHAYNNFLTGDGNGLELGVRAGFVKMLQAADKGLQFPTDAFYRDTKENEVLCVNLRDKSIVALSQPSTGAPGAPKKDH